MGGSGRAGDDAGIAASQPAAPSGEAMTEFAFADVWEAVAGARGDTPAQVQGTRRISWCELDRRADGVAAALLAAGASHQDKVANHLYNCPEYLEAVFGAPKAGLGPVNTNYRDGADGVSH